MPEPRGWCAVYSSVKVGAFRSSTRKKIWAPRWGQWKGAISYQVTKDIWYVSLHLYQSFQIFCASTFSLTFVQVNVLGEELKISVWAVKGNGINASTCTLWKVELRACIRGVNDINSVFRNSIVKRMISRTTRERICLSIGHGKA